MTGNETPKRERMLTMRQVSERFGVTVLTIRRWTNNGTLPCVGPPGKRRYRMTDVERIMDESNGEP